MLRAWIAGCKAARFANHRAADYCAATPLPMFGTPLCLSPILSPAPIRMPRLGHAHPLFLRSCDAIVGHIILVKLLSYTADPTCRFVASRRPPL
jgi:hypothetical protein